MRKFFFFLFVHLFFLSSYAQIAGSWQGVLIQKNTDGTTSDYAVWFELNNYGNEISGNYRSEQVNTPYYKVSEIKGKTDGNKINIREQLISNHLTGENMKWCFIDAKLTYNEKEGILKGFYNSQSSGCSSGEIVLLKSNKEMNTGGTEIIEYSNLNDVIDLLVKEDGEEAITGKQFILKDVTFQSAKYSITTSSYPYLNKIKTVLQEHPTIKIHLKGHTDRDGDDEKNFILSQKRAKSVANYLIKKGIDKNRISYEGYGESRPLSSSSSESGKQKNRRVELLIVSQ